MKIYKKGEGTASSFLISSLIGVSLLIIFGLIVAGVGNNYSVSNVPYFEGYEDVYGNVTVITDDYTGDYDTQLNDSKPDVSRTEDLLFFKAFKIIRKVPRILTWTSQGIGRISNDLMIPPAWTYVLITVLSILLITAIIKVIRGFKDV